MPTKTKADDAQTATLFETGEAATSKPKRARKTAATDTKPKPRARRTKAVPVELPKTLPQGVEVSAVPGAVIAPASLINGVIKAEEYLVQTSQEVDALMRAACDGRTGVHWESDQQALTRSHASPGSLHHVQLSLSEGERAQGVPLQVLEDLTFAQDPDFNFALLYISRLLAPPSPLAPRDIAHEWVDLDDVMGKIGLDPRSTKERIEMRSRVWRYLLFGARARIMGQRRGNYVNKRSGQRIETVIESPAWVVIEEEKPAQPQLFPEIGKAPLRVRLVASEAWTRLTTLPETAQYLPMGELLGAIPGNKPSGAWARVLGLSLSSFWRRQPRAALDGMIKPTRRELLERYMPRTAPPLEVLNSNHPRRAVEYWQGALQVLIDCGFLAKDGEALLSYQEMRDALPRQDWQDGWWNGTVDLRPGPQMRDAVQSCANALPVIKPRELATPTKKRKKTRESAEESEEQSDKD